MGNEQTWKIIATPADRWALAIFFLHKDLTFKTRKEQRGLYRARQALGLIEPTTVFMGEAKGTVPLAADHKTRNAFIVTPEVAEFVIDCFDRIEVTSQNGKTTGLSGAQLAGLEPILQQLEDRNFAKEMAERYPNATWSEEDEDWSVSLAPTVQQADKLVDVLCECISKAGDSFPRFKKLFLEEAKPALQNGEAKADGSSADQLAS